jgi:cyanate permease
VAWGVLAGVGLNIGLTIAVDKTLTDWFIRKRGLAQGIKFGLIGVGGVVAIPIVTWLVTSQGWRTTCLLWGIIMLAGTPLIWLFVKQQRPEYYGLLPDGARVESGLEASINGMIDRGIEYASSLQETEFTLREALRTRTYWFLAIAFSVQTMIIGGFNIHTIPFLTDMEIDPAVASGMMAMMVFFTIPGRFLGGVIADRIGKSRLQFLLAGAFFLQAVGIGTFILNQSMPALYVLLIFYGFSSGACTPIYLVILGRYFGRKAFGSILGSAFLFRAPISLVAPIYTGWVYDTRGSYIMAFSLFAALAAAATLLLLSVRAPRLPSTGIDITSLT